MRFYIFIIGVLLLVTKTQQTALPDACNLPMYQGDCTEYISRWYYESVTGACVEFIYSGCYGNANNFYTKDACLAQCT